MGKGGLKKFFNDNEIFMITAATGICEEEAQLAEILLRHNCRMRLESLKALYVELDEIFPLESSSPTKPIFSLQELRERDEADERARELVGMKIVRTPNGPSYVVLDTTTFLQKMERFSSDLQALITKIERVSSQSNNFNAHPKGL